MTGKMDRYRAQSAARDAARRQDLEDRQRELEGRGRRRQYGGECPACPNAPSPYRSLIWDSEAEVYRHKYAGCYFTIEELREWRQAEREG